MAGAMPTICIGSPRTRRRIARGIRRRPDHLAERNPRPGTGRRAIRLIHNRDPRCRRRTSSSARVNSRPRVIWRPSDGKVMGRADHPIRRGRAPVSCAVVPTRSIVTSHGGVSPNGRVDAMLTTAMPGSERNGSSTAPYTVRPPHLVETGEGIVERRRRGAGRTSSRWGPAGNDKSRAREDAAGGQRREREVRPVR